MLFYKTSAWCHSNRLFIKQKPEMEGWLAVHGNSINKLLSNKHFLYQENVQWGVCTNWGGFVKSWEGPVGAEQPHLILLQVKLDYRPNILLQTGCTAKFAFRLQRGSKLAKSAIFRVFFGFPITTAELFILQ